MLLLVLVVCVLSVGSTRSESQEKKEGVRVAGWLYEHALSRWKAELAAEIDNDEKMCFKDIDSVGVFVSMNEGALKVLSEQRVKDRFELTLRGYGVPVSETRSSDLDLTLSVKALWDKEQLRSAYILYVAIYEPLIFYRGGKPYKRMAALWEDRSYGYAGSAVVKRAFLEAIEEKAERVANLYLSANRQSVPIVSEEKSNP